MNRIIQALFLFLILILAGCGGGGGSTSAGGVTPQVAGVAATGAPFVGTVWLKDSSIPPIERSVDVPASAQGQYQIDVTDLKPPFLLRAKNNSVDLFSIALAVDRTNINPLSNLATLMSAKEINMGQVYADLTPDTLATISTGLPTALSEIQAQFASLLALYDSVGVNPISGAYAADHTGMDRMFDDVLFEYDQNLVMAVNRDLNEIFFLANYFNLLDGSHFDQYRPMPPVVKVIISPNSTSVLPGQTITFTAQVAGINDTRVSWKVTEQNGGTITQEGVYTAPSTPGTYHVVATSVADPTKSGTATVEVPVPSSDPLIGTWVGGPNGFSFTVTKLVQTIGDDEYFAGTISYPTFSNGGIVTADGNQFSSASISRTGNNIYVNVVNVNGTTVTVLLFSSTQHYSNQFSDESLAVETNVIGKSYVGSTFMTKK